MPYKKDSKKELTSKALRDKAKREKSYREQALKLFPWVCGICCREFAGKKLKDLTVHHRDHNHDNNPPDGSNWELLCIYCHDNVHSRSVEGEHGSGSDTSGDDGVTHQAFGALADLLKKKK